MRDVRRCPRARCPALPAAQRSPPGADLVGHVLAVGARRAGQAGGAACMPQEVGGGVQHQNQLTSQQIWPRPHAGWQPRQALALLPARAHTKSSPSRTSRGEGARTAHGCAARLPHGGYPSGFTGCAAVALVAIRAYARGETRAGGVSTHAGLPVQARRCLGGRRRGTAAPAGAGPGTATRRAMPLSRPWFASRLARGAGSQPSIAAWRGRTFLPPCLPSCSNPPGVASASRPACMDAHLPGTGRRP